MPSADTAGTTASDTAVSGGPTSDAAPGSSYAPTERSTPTRNRDRAAYDRALVHEILDEGSVCHLGFVRDGVPVVLPTLYGRSGETLYVHGSTGSRPLRDAGADDAGMPVCLTVTHVDGLVLARSAFHHSINYRSVVVHGTAYQVTGEAERRAALDTLTDSVVPGRAADSRPADGKELAATAVVRIELEEVSAKVRTGGPNDEPQDEGLPHWSGVVPVSRTYGRPVAAHDLTTGITTPDYLTALAH